MTDFQGQFVWYELMTSDVAAAASFYAQAIGWTVAREPHAPIEYFLFKADGRGVAGLMGLPERVSAPHWAGYVGVENISLVADRVQSLGGTICKPVTEIFGVGWFAVVADPQGAVFMLFQPAPQGGPEPPVAAGTLGHGGWHELYGDDIEAVFPFYAALFGWQLKGGMDMGAMGTYHFFAVGDGPVIGGMMKRPPQCDYAVWKFYFNVDSAARVAEFTQAQGGTLLQGPMQVPGGSWIVNARDPQGAVFCVVSAGS